MLRARHRAFSREGCCERLHIPRGDVSR
jgi:hypothetical protein